MTGYLTRTGIDLSYIFVSGNSGFVSGYLLSDGRDIGDIFAPYSTNSSLETGLKISSGADINTLFEAMLPIPLQLSGCCLWLDATDASTLTLQTGNKVSEWRDKSASAFSFVQATSAKQPTYTLNGQNSLATMTFNNANLTYLEGTANFAFGTNSYSLFCVCNTTNNTTNMGFFGKTLLGSVSGRILMIQQTTIINAGFTHGTGPSLSTSQVALSHSPGSYKLFEIIINRAPDNKDYLYQNGTLLTNVVTSDATNYAPTVYPMLVGAYGSSSYGSTPNSGYHLNGNICEIISYNVSANLTNANRQKIEGYLAWKWGIQTLLPVGHLYINSPP